jgi:hypothetical protein
MPRMARGKSSTGVYHVMIRGINQQNIFEEDEDKQRFVERLAIVKAELGFELYAYCLINTGDGSMILQIKEVALSFNMAITYQKQRKSKAKAEYVTKPKIIEPSPCVILWEG